MQYEFKKQFNGKFGEEKKFMYKIHLENNFSRAKPCNNNDELQAKKNN